MVRCKRLYRVAKRGSIGASTWIVPEMPAAAGPAGIEGDRPLLTTEVLHSIRDVRNGALQVIRVIGDSMSDLLLDGYKVLVDTRLQKPRERAEGGVIGYWREEAKGRVVLDKHNPDFESVRLGHRTEWFLVGTITKTLKTAGTTEAFVTKDYFGTTRTASYSIGAHEY